MAGHILLAPLLNGLGLVARGPVLLLAIAAGWVGGIHPRLHHLLHDLQLLLGTHPEALGEPKRPFEAMTSSIMVEVFVAATTSWLPIQALPGLQLPLGVEHSGSGHPHDH